METLIVNGKEVQGRRIVVEQSGALFPHLRGKAYLTVDDDIVFTHTQQVPKTEPLRDEEGEVQVDRHDNPVLIPVMETMTNEEGEPIKDDDGNEIRAAATEELTEITHVFPAGSPNRAKLKFDYVEGAA